MALAFYTTMVPASSVISTRLAPERLRAFRLARLVRYLRLRSQIPQAFRRFPLFFQPRRRIWFSLVPLPVKRSHQRFARWWLRICRQPPLPPVAILRRISPLMLKEESRWRLTVLAGAEHGEAL